MSSASGTKPTSASYKKSSDLSLESFLRNLPSWIWKQVLILFYFTKSDFKTTIIPITVFSAFAAPVHSTKDLLHTAWWIWLHLLQFDVSNQCIGVAEDRANKPDRPIASGRISLEDAWILRWALVPICIAYSACYSTPIALTSLGIAVMTVLYNEAGIHAGHWVGRNTCIAVEYGLYELGATYTAGKDKSRVDNVGMVAVLLTIGILATTYHVQDFKDYEGDKAIGRKTFPIVMPQLARKQVIVALTLWSLGVCYLWKLDFVMSTIVCGLGLYVGFRFMTMKEKRQDQRSFYYYNLWLTVVNCLPGIWRLGMQYQVVQ